MSQTSDEPRVVSIERWVLNDVLVLLGRLEERERVEYGEPAAETSVIRKRVWTVLDNERRGVSR